MIAVTYELGTKEGSTTFKNPKNWVGGDQERVYFECENSKKFNGIAKFYRVVSGNTGSDHAVEVNGVVFGFNGLFDSKTKLASAKEAAK